MYTKEKMVNFELRKNISNKGLYIYRDAKSQKL